MGLLMKPNAITALAVMNAFQAANAIVESFNSGLFGNTKSADIAVCITYEPKFGTFNVSFHQLNSSSESEPILAMFETQHGDQLALFDCHCSEQPRETFFRIDCASIWQTALEKLAWLTCDTSARRATRKQCICGK